jgi:D-alanine-D-alanine ligase
VRIAFTHNLQQSKAEEEAEFDTPETVAFIVAALKGLGHEVEPIDVSGPVSRTAARLEALQPDLVFNTAEGRRGKYREAFFPGLFEQLGLPFTGSDAAVCSLTLDKHLTKQVVAQHGVKTPRAVFIDDINQLQAGTLRFPVIVKPNFEGSSKGITQDSVVERADQLLPRVTELLARFPTGLLIEEFIEGQDVVVPFIEYASPATHGVLPPAQYEYDVPPGGRRIYDYRLKQLESDRVNVVVPAKLSAAVLKDIEQASRTVFRALQIRDLGRIDFRLADDGTLYFLEANALPSLEPGAAIYESAALVGLKSPESLFKAVLHSATRRQGATERQRVKPVNGAKRGALRVGLTFNLKRVKPQPSGDNDQEAEYDSRDTIDALREAIASFGHEVVELEATAELPLVLSNSRVDVVFNLAEGIRGRNREAAVPALLEHLGIPYSGSDAAALCLCLDKVLAKKLVHQAGVLTSAHVQMSGPKDPLPKGWRFPAVVKPVAEGSSKGVLPTSVAHNEAELRELVQGVVTRYQQPALVEEYLPGREFTVGLLGEERPRVLPPMEIVFNPAAGQFPLYTLEHKLAWVDAVRYEVPAKIEPKLLKELERAARAAFKALGCRDVARIDFRLDVEGRPSFIECNPLPGLSPGWSDLCLIASAAGIEYHSLVGEILAPAIRRFRAQERQSRKAARVGDKP